eukprot:Filipodium_phascolosomae@DN175_c0_g1_i1.p1
MTMPYTAAGRSAARTTVKGLPIRNNRNGFGDFQHPPRWTMEDSGLHGAEIPKDFVRTGLLDSPDQLRVSQIVASNALSFEEANGLRRHASMYDDHIRNRKRGSHRHNGRQHSAWRSASTFDSSRPPVVATQSAAAAPSRVESSSSSSSSENSIDSDDDSPRASNQRSGGSRTKPSDNLFTKGWPDEWTNTAKVNNPLTRNSKENIKERIKIAGSSIVGKVDIAGSSMGILVQWQTRFMLVSQDGYLLEVWKTRRKFEAANGLRRHKPRDEDGKATEAPKPIATFNIRHMTDVRVDNTTPGGFTIRFSANEGKPILRCRTGEDEALRQHWVEGLKFIIDEMKKLA